MTFSADPSGLSMRVALPGGEAITIADVGVGAQGFSGRLFLQGAGPDNPLQTTIFDGFTIGLTAFDVTLSNGGFAQSAVAGQFQTPFFSDGSGKPRSVDVELGFNADGGFSVALAATQSASPNDAGRSRSVELRDRRRSGDDRNRRRVVRDRPDARRRSPDRSFRPALDRHGGSPVAELRTARARDRQ